LTGGQDSRAAEIRPVAHSIPGWPERKCLESLHRQGGTIFALGKQRAGSRTFRNGDRH
jgi:hypothetical protein